MAPSQLVLGFGVTFQVSKESLRNHKTGRFDTPEVAEGLPAAEPVERKEFVQEQITTEAPKEAGDVNGKEQDVKQEQEQEQEQEQDSELDEEDQDQAPAKNPSTRTF